MKSPKLLVVLLLMFALPIIVVAQEEPSDKLVWPDLGGREVVVAVENAYPPYNLINEQGEAVGWDYDTFRDICQLLNCTPVFVQTSWDGILAAVAQGEFDVAADGITYTAERDETVDFSQLYQAYDETLLVRAGETRFTSAEELLAVPGFLVATQVGTTNEITAVELFGRDQVKSFEQFGPAVEALLNDDVDAVVIDRPVAQKYIAAHEGALTATKDALKGVEGLAFAFPPGSDLIYPINAAMSALQASGRWDEVYAKWFESDTAQ